LSRTATPGIGGVVVWSLLALPLVAGAQPGRSVRFKLDPIGIQAALDTYRQAIETKDMELLRRIRPGLSSAEIERFEQAFDQVDALQVTLTIQSMTASGDAAVVKGLREDRFLLKDGTTLHNEAPFTYTLTETPDGWVIVSIR
jgi:hypothetical protein